MSIPTSLIIAGLVVAWLAVLVPMVARRREPVPETEMDDRTFRVLRRASASIRRRPKFSRRNADDLEDLDFVEELDSEELLDDEALDEELLDNDDDDLDDELEEASEFEEAAEYEQAAEYNQAAEYEEVSYEEIEIAEYATVGAVRPLGSATADEQYYQDDARDRPEQHRRFEETRPAARRDRLEGLDESRLRPVPRRHGRGGYDPDAAELARAYRYSRRRKISVFLLLATIAFSVAAYLFKPVMWTGTAVFGLLLVAYLGYLRRQVRIENDIRQRRLTRLRRARQIRPEYHLDRVDEPVTGSSFGRRDVAISQVPPSGYRRGREIVDLEDDDPSFDDLDYYEPVVYRRASGQ